jgi:hypothetical protein
VQARDLFDTERVVSARVHIFGHACFNMSKILKLKHACLRHVIRLAHYVKLVRIYTCLTRVSTCSTYKFNKSQTKLKKYIRKIRVILVIKNKIDVSF